MKFVLDTNVYFGLLRTPDYLERHRAALEAILPRTWLSSVVLFELLRGARGDVGRATIRKMLRAFERVGRVIAPSHEDWQTAAVAQGRIWDRRTDLRSKPLQNDLLIAVSARRLGAVVVTENASDFTLARAQVSVNFIRPDEILAVL